MSTELTPSPAPAHIVEGAPEDGDAKLVRLWLHGRGAGTRRAYQREADRLRAAVGRPLPAVTLADLQAYVDGLAHLAPASRQRAIAATKSLLTFGERIGYLPVNVGAVLRLPKKRDQLTERIVDTESVRALLAAETDPRNHALLRLLYAAGLRLEEVCGLRWKHCVKRPNGRGQVTVYGKGGKTRAVALSAETWAELAELQGEAGRDDPVFRSRKGGPLSPSAAWRVVKAAAQRAGLPEEFSPHWLRHAHASHALDAGAPISLVKETLGHASIATTGRYLHARPDESSGGFLEV